MWTADRRHRAWLGGSWALAGLAATAALAGVTSAHAASLAVGRYELLNHPDGSAAAPSYGLRLDGLLDGDPNSIFTFSFEDEGANVIMDFFLDENTGTGTIDIAGTIFGGKDVGGSWENPALWQIEFHYEIVEAAASEPDLIAISVTDPANVGSLSGPLGRFNLAAVGGPPAFLLGENHRTSRTAEGWGWLNHALAPDDPLSVPHIYSSDWLFRVDEASHLPIPEPASAALLLGGLAALAAARRRRA